MTKVDRKLFVVVDDNDEYQFASESGNGTLLRRGARLRYLPASLSYELPAPEPRFKKGDRIWRGPGFHEVTVFARCAPVYTLERESGTRFLDDIAAVEREYELVPVPSFVVGEMVLDKPSGQYAKVLHFSEPFDRVRVQVGYGTTYTRHPDALEKLA